MAFSFSYLAGAWNTSWCTRGLQHTKHTFYDWARTPTLQQYVLRHEDKSTSDKRKAEESKWHHQPVNYTGHLQETRASIYHDTGDLRSEHVKNSNSAIKWQYKHILAGKLNWHTYDTIPSISMSDSKPLHSTSHCWKYLRKTTVWTSHTRTQTLLLSWFPKQNSRINTDRVCTS